MRKHKYLDVHNLATNAILTDEAVQIVGVARVVWDGEAAVTDGHLALTEGQREEAQLVQQTAERLQETWQVSQQDRGQRGRQPPKSPGTCTKTTGLV